MNEPNAPTPDDAPSAPDARSTDRSGWAQPPAPQSPGPTGAFNDRPLAPPGPPLPPGAGSPLQPGPPLSVEAPIRDRTINMTVLLVVVGAVIVLILLIAIVLNAVHAR